MSDIKRMIDIKKLYCRYCDITFNRFAGLKKHCLTGVAHENRVLASGTVEDYSIFHLTVAQRSIMDINENVVIQNNICTVTLPKGSIVLIDDYVWDIIKNYSIYSSTYPMITVGTENYRLHRYIYYNVFSRPMRPKYQVDHKNQNVIDATTDNLREFTHGEQSRNRGKIENCTSEYYDVSFHKNRNKWQFHIPFNGTDISYRYHDQLHAVYHRDLLIKEYGLDYCTQMNNIEKPDDFIPHIKKIKNRGLPDCIFDKKGGYCYRLHDKYSNPFVTIEEALDALNEQRSVEAQEKIDKILEPPILRNANGNAIINIFHTSKLGITTQFSILVDTHLYHELLLLELGMRNNYVHISKLNISLSKYLTKCTDPLKVVDHRDGNTSNYQLNNLRPVTIEQNAQNKLSRPNSSSIYVGVSIAHGLWSANIKRTYLGRHLTEYDAVIIRDMKAYELNLLGNMYRINLPVELQMNLFIKALNEEHFQFDYLYYQD